MTVNFDLPERIGGLGRLAYNLWWSWHTSARELFRALDLQAWRESGDNPVRMLSVVSRDVVESAAQDPDFLAHYDAVMDQFAADTTSPAWDFTPITQTIEFGTGFSYDLNASDLSGIDHWWINNTANFSINSIGVVSNATTLSVGEYWLEIRACDPYNNYCTIVIKIIVQSLPTDGDDDDDTGPQELTFPMENLLILIGIISGVAAIGIIVVIMRRGRSATIV